MLACLSNQLGIDKPHEVNSYGWRNGEREAEDARTSTSRDSEFARQCHEDKLSVEASISSKEDYL
jgi:hypothetical protein